MSLDLLRHDVVPLVLVASAVLCFGIYWVLWSGRDSVSLTGAFVKSGATGLVALTLLLDASLFTSRLHPDSLLWLMALGLLFGAIGDFALARRSDRAFLSGMAAFAIGHVIYAAALCDRSEAIRDALAAKGATQSYSIGQWIALVGLLVLLASTEFWLAPRTGKLRWPVRGYVVVNGAMAAVAFLLTDYTLVGVLQLGAGLFVLSDLLLALRLFVVTDARAKRMLSLALWPAYWLGQMLLMVGALGYWIALKG